mmetsp:Transcript_2473/g.9083  ORF Transcript_2473/g.9083 Transcript_2473/m.9083 type:complete len:198 (-) Transcript_2473:76-669(-)
MRAAIAPKTVRVGAVSQRGRSARGRPVRAAAEAESAGTDPSTLGKALPAQMDINEIMNVLPHRYPFLLVDRVIEVVPGEYCIGLKNVTVNDNFFPGHFPTRPIMPGVLQIEAMAQVGGLVLLEPGEEGSSGGTQQEFFFGGVDKVKWRRPVVPGDQLVIKTTLTKMNKRFGIAKMKGEAWVGDEKACEAELTLALVK